MERITVTDLVLNTGSATSIREIVQYVDDNIVGRLANKSGDFRLDNVDTLLRFVAEAGGGNHLEIGTLFGGSAIAVALLKEELSQSGIIVCIDPLDGYYGGADLSGAPAIVETLFRNIELFNVGNRILVMQAYSQMCIDMGMSFSTAYIDGDHENDTPLRDWMYVKDIVSKYVIFDNHQIRYPDVRIACRVADSDPEWRCIYSSGITYVVERIVEMPLATLDMLERI